MLPFFKYRPSSIKSFKVTCDCYRYYFHNSTGNQCDFTNNHSHSGDHTSDSFISSHYDFQVTVTFKLHCKITMTDFLVICNLLQNAASTSQRRLCWQQKLHLCHSAFTVWSHLDHDVIRIGVISTRGFKSLIESITFHINKCILFSIEFRLYEVCVIESKRIRFCYPLVIDFMC